MTGPDDTSIETGKNSKQISLRDAVYYAIFPFSVAIASVISILIIAVISLISHTVLGMSIPDSSTLNFLSANAIYLLLSGISVFSANLGYTMIKSAGVTSTFIIPERDRGVLVPIIEQSDDPIGIYIKLSSLTTIGGRFTQMGLHGLPLATILLTIFFSGLALFGSDGFLDLAKLALGAFIGSYVQKEISEVRSNQKSKP